MAREVINVGTAPNDGTGDPIRTSFIKCNNNFGELYSRVQTNPPASLIGTIGDQAGMYAYDSSYFYYCFQDYDGSSIIWAKIPNVVLGTSEISNGTSAVSIPVASGNVMIDVGGTSNLAVFSNVGAVINGDLTVTGNANLSGNIVGDRILNGTTSIEIPSSGGNANITIGGVSNVVVIASSELVLAGNLMPGSNVTFSIGDTNNRWQDLWLANSSIYMGDITLGSTGNALTINGANVLTGNAGAFSTTGNITGGNLSTSGTASVSGNITGGNILTSGLISATANIQAGNFYTAGLITSGPQTITGNVDVTGNINVTGNLNYSNVTDLVVGDPLIYIGANNTGNVYDLGMIVSYDDGLYQHGGWVRDASDGTWKLFGNVVAEPTTTVDFANAVYQPMRAGSITGTSGTFSQILSADGNVTGGNIITGGYVTATGNVTGAYIIGDGSLLSNVIANVGYAIKLESGTTEINIPVANGNIVANVSGSTNLFEWSTVGFSAVGNITGNYILGNGSLLTGIITSVANINDGTSIMEVVSSGGNIRANVGGTANLMVLSSTGVYVTGIASVTGNITGGNLSGTNIIGTLTTAAQNNITSVGTLSSLTVTGNIAGGNLSIGTGTISIGNVINNNSNGVGNIGTTGTRFNTVFAVASSALYADLAEYYLADANYPAGTVVKFGGDQEITKCDQDHDVAVAGIISARPAYEMNAGLTGDYPKALALAGRVWCRVAGSIRKGQMLVSTNDGSARAEIAPKMGAVIGKALQDFDGDTGMIEVVVGRL